MSPTATERAERIAQALTTERGAAAPKPDQDGIELSENSVAVLNRRYLKKDEDGNPTERPIQMMRRVAENLAKAELTYNPDENHRRQRRSEFLNVMKTREFLPNSPTLMNAGRELQQLSACYVLPVADSMYDIFTTVRNATLIHKSGGGTGFAFSRLRHRGDRVGSTGGIASGPVSFIQAFDAATETVKQGGTRRGANMAILAATHPDVMEFISSKADGHSIQNFNISVGITEEFMRRAQEGQTYDLISPRTGEIAAQVNAKDVFDAIVNEAWATGDPGVVFLDRINRDNPNPQLGDIESTNPCVIGETLVMTEDGPRAVRDLVGKRFKALVQGEYFNSGQEGFFSTGVKPTIKITAETEDGPRTVTLTPEHLVRKVQNGQGAWETAGSLKTGDIVEFHNHGLPLNRTAATRARMSEDATQAARLHARKWGNRLEDTVRMGVAAVAAHNANPTTGWGERLGIHTLPRLLDDTGAEQTTLHQKVLQKIQEPELASWLEETRTWSASVRHDLREALSRVWASLPAESVTISQVGTISSIEDAGLNEVYDVEIPLVHMFDGNGFVLHNCGEQPLAPYESCNLGSVNLALMVKTGPDGPYIDYERMEQVTRIAVRMLDNVIDMNNYPVDEIAHMSRTSRRIGVGVMGFADMLIALGIRYDSEEGLEKAEEVMAAVQTFTHRASAQLAEERGCFPAWDQSIYAAMDPPQPMRNSAPVTIAPTGTISIIAGASSGIEPLFALSYVRNVMDNTKLVESNPMMEAVARQEGFYSEENMEQLAQEGSLENIDAPEWVKEVFRTSHQIEPEWHVRMQAAFQRHTDNSVSKTINFPSTATREDIRQAYQLAYTTGCKGITVYRDGSKEGQVLSTGDTARAGQLALNSNGEIIAQRRPREMQGTTLRTVTGHGTMYVTVNLDEDNRPFEIFTNLGKAGGCDSAQMEALSRVISLALRSGICSTEITDNLLGITCCPIYDNGQQITSVPDAIAKVLLEVNRNRGIANDDQTPVQIPLAPMAQLASPTASQPVEGGIRRCPDCNADLIYKEGCRECPNIYCGWSNC